MFSCSVSDISLVEYKEANHGHADFSTERLRKDANAETQSLGRPYTDRNRNEATARQLPPASGGA